MSGDRQTDADLVRAMAEGDAGAPLERFYRRFGGATLALLQRMLGSKAEAEALLEEVFVELWRRAPAFDPDRTAVSTWVATIARSRALIALRASERRAEQRPDAAGPALEALGEEERRVLELAYFQGLSESEIAKTIEAPIGVVRSRIVSAMRALRSALAGSGAGGAR